MGGRDVARRLLEATVVVCPLVVALTLPPRLLPGSLAFVLSNGWWLAAAGVVATILAVVFSGFRPAGRVARVVAPVLRGRRAWLTLLAVGFLVPAWSLPGWRLVGPAGGDEPKYLRIAMSLYRDLDTDVGSNQEGQLTASGFARNVRRLMRSSVKAAGSLVRRERPPADHVWSLGNWTIRGWHGGDYHVQGPGLPALLAPALGLTVSQHAWPTIPRAALTAMALVFALAFAQTTLLAGDLAGSRPAGALAASFVMLSPAVFVGGYHLYPDAVAVAVVPCLARHAWSGGPALRPLRVVVMGLVAGSLVWLHVKYLLLSVVAIVLLARRLGRTRSLVLIAATSSIPLAAWLLYQYRLTGLLRPDALYMRFGSEVWSGLSADITWRFVSGLGNALFGARDGIFVMVPVVSIAALGVPWLWRGDREAAQVLAALSASVWFSAALHGGGAPGPPGRLLAPLAPLFAVPLAVAARRLGCLLAFRWSLAAAVIVSLAVAAAMGNNPRRTVNPYRRLVGAADFVRDLPAGRATPIAAAADLTRTGLLLTVVGFWARRFSRKDDLASPASPTGRASRVLAVWRRAVAFQAGAWLTVALCAVLLHALTVLSGG